MRTLAYVIAALMVAGIGTGCKNACDKAADITENDCGITIPEGDGDAEEVECEGDTEALAQCTVDNKDDYCDFLSKLQNGEIVTNAYTDCATPYLGG